MLYPLKFNSILKEKIWGGHKLHFKSNTDIPGKKIGESWEVSGIKHETSIVENGKLQGKNLQELLAEFKEDLVGKSVFQRFKNEFPILIKFIEARENLSVQVHPDDQLAKKRHKSFGKTEMWYVVENEDDARIIIDFKTSITIDAYEELLNQDALESALNTVKVKEGDSFFIKPGLVHAIGAGVLLAEIQQTSDITYRLYDWNRTDIDGNSRELHTDLALEAIDFSGNSDYKIRYNPKLNSKVTLADTPYFVTNFIEIKGFIDLDYSEMDSFVILMNVGTSAVFIIYKSMSYQLFPKETILIPACLQKISLESEGSKLLEISI
ncbi:type I phosphomannose isomerase catalytic subunit [Psychroflexus sediminis]|uniref:Mannose-6-phosphate isomerase, type 1 n=1 Tax=Psychroflexus sediminis TaxID=470826 RepID=A0A1G7ZAV2_9FLAO|nr:type I phosphomannose isomerase catalytic subunit [Psychroflexus sediminis]SDH05745.1 mannose-6-phosphate isomerase, type 1 [Psychroflexus sediminis]